MSVEPCNQCGDLRAGAEIRASADLSHAILLLREKLTRGELIDITQSAHSPSGKFLELPLHGPWPGYVEHYFRCSRCPSHFRLAVDTLHGHDGSFEGAIEPFK
jgi:hypothetical protein